MTSSVDYDIAQLQTDLNRLQSDLARLENDLTSEQIMMAVTEDNPIVAEEIVEAGILTKEGIIPTPIIPEPVVYENQGWIPTPIPTTLMMDEEIARAALAQVQKELTIASGDLNDAEVPDILTNSNMEYMNMINPINRSQKILNAITSLLAAASTLIAAEAGAMWEEEKKIYISPHKKDQMILEAFFNINLKDSPKIKLKKINIKRESEIFCNNKKDDIIETKFQIKIKYLDIPFYKFADLDDILKKEEPLDFIEFETTGGHSFKILINPYTYSAHPFFLEKNDSNIYLQGKGENSNCVFYSIEG